ncbi:hypothetical protein SERLA73DRAFT_175790 [Serpula lacrymans var. lacrymans S7.3]|uniref:HhH-GPD domain-containing protein n=2 Tax=Serpula lacrymans var. lacrymans TaxID=341189 RepID=F8PIW1_SERL3|nr:uncharacterized protein SERLADRAFT_458392 [Serpula lacrymans var. lacrymans S7.9]EGO04061.1 hypothetical protein SERLA73DRAFT_175790 [Serpula lacrymans var. lacrymans S7.3]EGO29978.1 hypothetical protein SERLADRAFT_458392 [Serpula lacrymans var. lacrymans S7.9]
MINVGSNRRQLPSCNYCEHCIIFQHSTFISFYGLDAHSFMPAVKRKRSITPLTNVVPVSLSTNAQAGPSSPHASKKLKLLSAYTTASPFPSFHHPTNSEATEIHELLAKYTPGGAPRLRAPSPSANAARTCGSVPNVLESLIGTILSQNTSSANSTRAKHSLDTAFGRNDFAAIAKAARPDVVAAIASGGLANKKAKTIQDILESVKQRHGAYNLQHLADVPDEEAMRELVSYNGVGPKTAACVLSFCLGRESFAVDTHVYRLSRLLGWVPQSADRVLAQAHLDVTLPGELKYALHVMMVKHGRICSGCKKDGKGSCPLKEWLKEHKGVKADEVEERVVEAEEHIKEEERKQVKTSAGRSKRVKKS